MYQLVHFLHLTMAALWFGAHVAGDYLTWTMDKAGDRLERARTVRRVQIALEMPVAAIVPVLGFIMGVLQPTWWREGWLHAKLTALVALLGLLFLAARRNRHLVTALEAGDDASVARHWHGYLILRTVGLAAFLLIFVAVVFRF